MFGQKHYFVRSWSGCKTICAKKTSRTGMKLRFFPEGDVDKVELTAEEVTEFYCKGNTFIRNIEVVGVIEYEPSGEVADIIFLTIKANGKDYYDTIKSVQENSVCFRRSKLAFIDYSNFPFGEVFQPGGEVCFVKK